jgi:thymidine kinase
MINIIFSTIIFLISALTYILFGDGCVKLGGGDTKLMQKKVLKKYKKYKLPKKRASFYEFCYPKEWRVQPQQEFVAEYMKPSKTVKTLLVDHLIGAGKSCLMIKTAENYLHLGKPMILMPASLTAGFRDELRGACAGRTDAFIDKNYNILSFNMFQSSRKKRASILIIDEVQNIINQGGEFFKAVVKYIEDNADMPVLVATGTPVFDNPSELFAIARMLRLNLSGDISVEKVRKVFSGKVSFFAGAPDYTFPTTYINIVNCRMSQFQTRWYQSQVEAEKTRGGDITLHAVANNFYIKSRQRANIVYPRGLANDDGLAKITRSVIDELPTYSAKIAKLLRKLYSDLSFIYTDFTGAYGINALTKVLDYAGYKNYLFAGAGKKRYVVWSGEQTIREKGEIRTIFNSRENDNASQIQIVIGSPAIKEGVSLLRIRGVHILSPYWNWSRLQQIYGRAVRFCSHKSLPTKMREVEIYIYCAVIHGYRDGDEITPENSIDLYMLNIADKKKEENEPYLRALMDVSIDKLLFQ